MASILRKLIKLPVLYEYDRKDLIEELNYTKYERKYRTERCPICGCSLYTNSWSEDHWGVVETIVRCGRRSFDETHYSDHYSYGSTDLIAGNYYFSYRHNTPWEEIDRIRSEWLMAVVKTKTGWKRNKELSYRKGKSQLRRLRKK